MSNYSNSAASTSHCVSQMMITAFLWVGETKLHLYIYLFSPNDMFELKTASTGTLILEP